MHGIVDEKTDVFAFGVLLLELLTGRRALDFSQQSLVLWVRFFFVFYTHWKPLYAHTFKAKYRQMMIKDLEFCYAFVGQTFAKEERD